MCFYKLQPRWSHQRHFAVSHPGIEPSVWFHLHGAVNAELNVVQVVQNFCVLSAGKCCMGVVDIPLPKPGLHFCCHQSPLLHILHGQCCSYHQTWVSHSSIKGLLICQSSKTYCQLMLGLYVHIYIYIIIYIYINYILMVTVKTINYCPKHYVKPKYSNLRLKHCWSYECKH